MNRPKIYVTRAIPEAGLNLLKDCDLRIWREERAVPREVLAQELAWADGLLCMLSDRIDGELLDGAPNLKIVSNMAVGYDNINVPDCTARRVMVTNTPGVLTETTADLAWALLMATARRVVEGARVIERGQWKSWAPMFLAGMDVYGATLGLVGMGRIGRAVARRARGFDMKVIYHNRRRDPEAERELGVEYRGLDDLLRESDFVSLHMPLTPETRGMIGEREISLMKPTAVLINTARGAVVDEMALYRALEGKKIWAAGLDVFEVEPVPLDNPLLKLDNVVAIPHIGSASIATRTKMAVMAAQSVLAGVTGQRPQNLVNPEVLGG